TGGHNLTFADVTAILVGGDPRRLDALGAIGAFFHDAARTHGYVRIVRRMRRRIRRRAVIKPIEAPNLVGAITRAGARADAAVVDHLIDAVGRVHGGVHRAAHLARRLLAVHARHRLEIEARIVDVPGVVTVDAQPLHFAAHRHLFFADDRDVVPAVQALMQALQPMHRSRSIAMPQASRGYGQGG